MGILVRTYGKGTRLVLVVVDNETILSIKKKIHQSEWCVPVPHQTLFFAGNKLEDEKTLSDYCVLEECTRPNVKDRNGDCAADYVPEIFLHAVGGDVPAMARRRLAERIHCIEDGF